MTARSNIRRNLLITIIAITLLIGGVNGKRDNNKLCMTMKDKYSGHYNGDYEYIDSKLYCLSNRGNLQRYR